MYTGFNDLTTQPNPLAQSFYAKDGELEVNKVKTLSRSFARAIAGTPTWMFFSPDNSIFSLLFTLNTVPPLLNNHNLSNCIDMFEQTITQPTEIYLNEAYYYPNGYIVTTSPSQGR
jgi:hypothetical protein